MWALRLECAFGTTSPPIMHDFHAAIRTHCGDNWLDTWWSTIPHPQRTLDSENQIVRGSLKPSSFLEFATQVELFTFSESEISREISRNPEVPRSPKLLFYMIVGNGSLGDWEHTPFRFHSPKQWQDFARFLLRSGFDPNIALEVEVGPDCGMLMNLYRDDGKSDEEDTNEDADEDADDGEDDDVEDEEDNEDEHSIVSEDQDSYASENRRPITAMHLALAIACSSSVYTSAILHLEMLAVLVEGGGNANVLNYRNYWSHQEGDATERSAIHYLLSSSYDGAGPFHHPEREVNRALSRCIIAFLNHGADPNAADSNGLSVLELALPICPYALAELMLEKGARVTPKLLSESGAPLDYAEKTRMLHAGGAGHCPQEQHSLGRLGGREARLRAGAGVMARQGEYIEHCWRILCKSGGICEASTMR
jgi:hypothetical protein